MANIYDMADTWNDAGTVFTAIKMNVTDTASDANSLLMDLQVGGTSKFEVDKNGTLTIAECPFASISANANGLYVGDSSTTRFRSGQVKLGDSTYLGWGGVPSGSVTLTLYQDAANTLAQRNGAYLQEFRIYNTYTSDTDYERGFIKWDTNVLKIGTEAAGTGTGRRLVIDQSTYVAGNVYVESNNQISFAISDNPTLGGGLTLYNYLNSTLRGGWKLTGSSSMASDTDPGDCILLGVTARASATTNLVGGDVLITAGHGASGSAGNAHGGNVIVSGGTGYGTGHDGYVVLSNLPTSDPVEAGAIWNDSGTLKISAG